MWRAMLSLSLLLGGLGHGVLAAEGYDAELCEAARAELCKAVDALAAPDIARGVVDIDNMVEAQPDYETERPPVYARIFKAAYDATGEERCLGYFRAIADLLVAIKQPPGGYSRTAYVKRVGAAERHEAGISFRNGRDLAAVTVILQAHEYTGEEKYLRSAIETADFLVEAQFECGAWPSEWPPPQRSWLAMPMLNDLVTITQTRNLMQVYERTEDEKYLRAIERTGQWLIDWQLPEPTPGWAQEYDWDRKPTWGRRFEPPGACSSPSCAAIGLLMDIHLLTGEEKYLSPIPAAAAWLDRARIEEDRWARFYEVKTGRPLYFTSDNRTTYWLTYDDGDVPDHYAFKGNWGFDSRKARWDRLQAIGREALIAEESAQPSADALWAAVGLAEPRVRELIGPEGFIGTYPAKGGDVRRLASAVSTVSRYLIWVRDLRAMGEAGQ
jgi:hypothetical protein